MSMQLMMENDKIYVMKPRWNDEDVEKIVRRQHTWLSGLIPPRDFHIEGFQDIYIPYIMTGVKYYKREDKARRCYVFENMESGVKSGVIGIENLEFIEEDARPDQRPIAIEKERHREEIAHYCNLQLLARNYRKFINWTIELLEVRIIFRIKRVIFYQVNGKMRTRDIFLDSMILK